MKFVLISSVLQSVTTVLQDTREMNCLRDCCALYSSMVKSQVFGHEIKMYLFSIILEGIFLLVAKGEVQSFL